MSTVKKQYINRKQFFLIAAIISFLLSLGLNILHVFSKHRWLDEGAGIPYILRIALFSFFLFVLINYLQLALRHYKALNVRYSLWRVFIVECVVIFILLLLMAAMEVMGILKHDPYIGSIINQIALGATAVFLGVVYITFQKLILYQKNKNLMRVWTVFKFTLYSTLILSLLEFDPFSSASFIGSPLFYVVLIIELIGSVIISLNVKWVAYLEFKTKWIAIVLFLLILTGVIGMAYLIQELAFPYEKQLAVDYTHLYFIASFLFVGVYSVLSILVLLFNLPTSSVFEQKFGEVMNFQKLSQMNAEQKEADIIELLFISSQSTVIADAGWIEWRNEEGKVENILQGISPVQKNRLRDLFEKEMGLDLPSALFAKTVVKNNLPLGFDGMNWRSFIMVPLIIGNEKWGTIGLLKTIKDGFDKDMANMVETYASQAVSSIQNARLLKKAVEHERYASQIAIAQRMQQHLLPAALPSIEGVELGICSGSPDMVGGDYYDSFEVAPHKLALVVGDVSGKGTGAAFNMAQMKGAFNSLAQLKLPLDMFLELANKVMLKCLGKSDFITLLICIVDTKRQLVEFARAGHTPLFYYKKENSKVYSYEPNGLALGMVGEKKYKGYSEAVLLNYKAGDKVLMYTDGIIEARNPEGEEFGMERLSALFQENANLSAQELVFKLKEELFNFTQDSEVDDDYTLVAIELK